MATKSIRTENATKEGERLIAFNDGPVGTALSLEAFLSFLPSNGSTTPSYLATAAYSPRSMLSLPISLAFFLSSFFKEKLTLKHSAIYPYLFFWCLLWGGGAVEMGEHKVVLPL